MTMLLFTSRARPAVDWSFYDTLPAGLTFTRSSTGYAFDASGVLTAFGNDEPRFDYDPSSGEALGLLIENSRTNGCFPSVPDGGIFWTNSATAQTPGYQAPDGSMTAVLIADTAINTSHICQQNINQYSYVSGTMYTMSAFVKKMGQDVVQMTFPSAAFGTSQYANVNLTTGSVMSQSGVTTSVRPCANGWYRVSITATATATATGGACIIILTNSTDAARTSGYLGTDTGILVWGGQMEAGAYATSYIPTTTSAATRAIDTLFTTQLPWLNSDEGTVMVSVLDTSVGATSIFAEFNDDSYDNRLIFGEGMTACAYNTYALASMQSSLNLSRGDVSKAGKLAARYKLNECNFAYNGTVANADTSCAVPVGIKRLRLGHGSPNVSSYRLDGWLRQFRYWPRAFNDTDLKRIST